MTTELMLRVIGYLSLLAAILYLVYLFAPVDWSRLRFRMPGLPELPGLPSFPGRLPAQAQLDLPAWGRYMSDLEVYDSEHAARIAHLARRLGQAASLPPETLASLEQAGYLHDLGEEDLVSTLSKPAPLTPAERDALREHPLIGERTAQEIGASREAAFWVRWHHERVDGTGYPDGLMGEAIPLPARVLAIADAYEAITHRRPYREALEPDEALAELQRLAGMAYDSWLVAVFAEQVYPELLAGESS